MSILFGMLNACIVNRIELHEANNEEKAALLSEKVDRMIEISTYIREGAVTYLWRQYKILFFFIVIMAIIIFFAVEEKLGQFWTTIPFILGCVTSIVSGYIGMRIAVAANVRTTKQAIFGLNEGFRTAFRAGAVMGFILVGLALIMLAIIILIYQAIWDDARPASEMYDAIAGYGLGGSSMALFGRVGGGIYTKAADVGADLVGKVVEGLAEDSPQNPGVIADNVGDNVGDIAGMGSDLFGSFAESSCAALVVGSSSADLLVNGGLFYPLMISAFGIVGSIITSFFATNFMRVDEPKAIERTLKWQLFISTFIMTPVLYGTAVWVLPETFTVSNEKASPLYAWICAVSGLWGGLIIGISTEYFTSNHYRPVRQLSESCETGAATNIIYGIALGFLSDVIPIIALAITIYFSFWLCGMYGVALAALGMLSTLCIALTIDAYGPISDNAGGIAEMCGLEETRVRTDALDAAGNTTAAIGKGFAIGSAALVALALFGAFVTRTHLTTVNILSPLMFAGLVIGAMLPYAFTAMTMKSVGLAAKSMIQEISNQFNTMRIREGEDKPNYDRCIDISTTASLREMIAPGLLVLVTPFVVGILFGPKGVSGVLAGAIVSGVQMAISFSNAGGAWDNAKKYIECKCLQSHSSYRYCGHSRTASAEGNSSPRGRCDRRHCRRSAQGHIRTIPQHLDQADGYLLFGVRWLLRAHCVLSLIIFIINFKF